jgi:hypothetical protein
VQALPELHGGALLDSGAIRVTDSEAIKTARAPFSEGRSMKIEKNTNGAERLNAYDVKGEET